MDMIGFIAFIDVVTVPTFFRYYLLLLVFFLSSPEIQIWIRIKIKTCS